MFKRELAFTAAAAALALAMPAFAQDDSPWSGFYAGATAGVAFNDVKSHLRLEQGTGAPIIPPADFAAVNALATDSDKKNGFAGALEAGYNYQMGELMVGLETDFGFMGLKKTNTHAYQSRLLVNPPINYALQNKVSADWLWTLRPRIGYVSGNWLFFGSAGIGISKLKITARYADNLTPPGSAAISDSSSKTGFAGGLGVGYAMGPNWSAKGEWLYTDFGKVRASSSTPNGVAVVTAEGKAKANLFRVGLDYSF